MANLMVFYKGAINYNDLKQMPIPEIMELQKNAERINKEIRLEQERQQRSK